MSRILKDRLIHQLVNEKISAEEKKKLIDTATELVLTAFSGRVLTYDCL